LVDTERAMWHVCPCCVGNLSRTLLMIPTWSYVKGRDSLYVNMFVGSRIQVGKVAGTAVEVVQKTDYPWNGKVAITINPAEAQRFSVHVRIPDRTTSKLYKEQPPVRGLSRLLVNGQTTIPVIEKGYAVVTREWKAGDSIEIELPMEPQRVAADRKISADQDLVALKYGPLIYNVERADQNIDQKLGTSPLQVHWRPDILGGVMTVVGKWADGSELIAIPNYARMNRGGPPPAYPTENSSSDFSGKRNSLDSKVWI